MADNNGATPPPNGQKRPPGSNLKMSRNVVSWLLLLGVAMVLVTLLNQNMNAATPITLSQFWTFVKNKQVESLVIKEDGVIEGKRRAMEGDQPGQTLKFQLTYPKEAIDSKFLQQMIELNPDADIKAEKPSQLMVLLITMLPWILIFAFIWFFIFRQIRGAAGPGGMLGSFGRSRHRMTHKEHTNITFADVAGIDEAKEEVREIIEFLKSPKKFQRLGGRIPRGILLVGSPGCGKTLLAKAIAGEADVPFFSISGSDFVEMFVGVGASRVRDLFKQAKENSPCIIFLDEIDAVGRKRGASFGGGGHDEREQTLNAILVEMDGFDTNSQVIVIAATNRADVLDPALIRPGRFDRQVYVSLPDVQGRYEILKVHMRKIKLGPTVDIRRCARGTPMFSGAELAAMVNEAALIATMQNKEFVEQDDLEEARDKIRWGRAKKSRVMDEKETRATAYHEAGHALVQALLPDADPLHKVSIIPRGPYAGMTAALPEKDRTNYSYKYLRATMRVLCAGRIAEQMFCGDINTGAMADIRQVTEMARKMVTEWGMTDRLGFVSYADEEHRTLWGDLPAGRDYSEPTAEAIDQEVRRLVDEAYEDARKMIHDHRERLEAIAQALLKCETLTGEEVNALIRGESVERTSVDDILDRVAADDRVGQARPVQAETKPQTELGGGPLPQPG